jgi:ATP-binding cassette subfamily C (CFTR/MRP) protein 1
MRLFGTGGLLRRLGTTVIYTTYDGKCFTESCTLWSSDCSSEQFKSSADRVFDVGVGGSLTELSHQRSNLLDLMEISSPPGALPEKNEKVVEAVTTKNDSEAKKTPSTKTLIQDRTVYKTYFKSVGTLHTGIFLAFGVVFAFTSKFPGMVNSPTKRFQTDVGI